MAKCNQLTSLPFKGLRHNLFSEFPIVGVLFQFEIVTSFWRDIDPYSKLFCLCFFKIMLVKKRLFFFNVSKI